MTTYHLVTNSIDPTQVRETDTAFVIEDVPFIRPMRLSGGYVPERSISQTINGWAGAPVTLTHPRNDRGEPVAANRQPELHVGRGENPEYDATTETGFVDIRVEKDRLAEVDGGDTVREKLESGEAFDVSSQYAAADLPPGEYDGQQRQNAEEIVRPDSIALLPEQRGQCSVADGCGITPELVANAEVSVPMTRSNAQHGEDTDMTADATFDVGDLVRWQTSASPGTGRVAEAVTEPGEQVSAEGADVTREATEDEAAYKLDNWNGDRFEMGTVVKSESELLGEWDNAPDAAMQANVTVPDEYRFDNPGEAVEAAQELGFEGAGDEITHTHGEGADTVFMPGPSHEALVERLREMGELSGNATAMELTSVMPDDVEFTDREWDGSEAIAAMPNPSEDMAAADVLDQTHAVVPTADGARDNKANWKLPFRRGPDEPVNTRALVAIDAALSGGRGGVDGLSDTLESEASDWVSEMLAAAPDDLFGATEEQSANVLASLGRGLVDALGIDIGTTGAESPVDSPAGNPPTTTVNRQDLIDDITANSQLTEQALSARCDDGLQAIHEDIMSNDNDDTSGDGGTTDGGDITLDDLSDDAQDALVERAAERIKANRDDEQKAELAADIVANSAEYDDTDAVQEDFPTVPALEAKRDSVTDAGAGIPSPGSFDGVANSDDDLPDVSSGILSQPDGGDD